MKRHLAFLMLVAACDLYGSDSCGYPDRPLTYDERLCIDIADAFGGCCTLTAQAAPAALALDATLNVEIDALLALPRTSHRTTRLPDGRVLVSGGYDQGGHLLDSAELVDPLALRSTLLPSRLVWARAGHVQILLDDGRVLLAGGEVSGVALAACEVFDPTTLAFEPAAPLVRARAAAEALLLVDGRVLLADSFGSGAAGIRPLGDPELYDPRADAWYSLGGA
jgi:hypothetical protein